MISWAFNESIQNQWTFYSTKQCAGLLPQTKHNKYVIVHLHHFLAPVMSNTMTEPVVEPFHIQPSLVERKVHSQKESTEVNLSITIVQ